MKKMPFILFATLIISIFNYGCGTFQTTSKTTRVITVDEADVAMGEPEINVPTDPTIVGNDRDVHGCIRSAGYTWSQVQGRCVQLFNEGIKLLPVENGILNTSETQSNAVFQSFIIFSSDSLRAELFMPNKEPLLFHKTASNSILGTWISNNYKIEYENNLFIIKQNMDIILKQY
jgi:hypothetical protein